MGQKSNPIGLRLQINRTWDSRWYAEGRDYAQLLKEDIAIRKFIMDSLPQAAISRASELRSAWVISARRCASSRCEAGHRR